MSGIDQVVQIGFNQLPGSFHFECHERELNDIVTQHALAATGIGLIPVPGADVAALAANTWIMYARMNEVIGISFSNNFLKSVASGVIANVVSFMPGPALAVGAQVVLKLFPGVGTGTGMMIGAMGIIVVMYIASTVYLNVLKRISKTAKEATEENIRAMAEQVPKDRDILDSAYREGKQIAKDRGASTKR